MNAERKIEIYEKAIDLMEIQKSVNPDINLMSQSSKAFYGICGLYADLFSSDLITDDEYEELRSEGHRIVYEVEIPYSEHWAWGPGEKEPRKEWLLNKIEELKSKNHVYTRTDRLQRKHP